MQVAEDAAELDDHLDQLGMTQARSAAELIEGAARHVAHHQVEGPWGIFEGLDEAWDARVIQHLQHAHFPLEEIEGLPVGLSWQHKALGDGLPAGIAVVGQKGLSLATSAEALAEVPPAAE
jgi:hypothetical protein